MAGLYSVKIQINDEDIFIKPNSLSFSDGFGEVTTRSVAAGNSLRNIAARNLETAQSMCKFTLLVEDDTPDKVREWKNNIGGNTINLSSANFTRSFTGMSISPEVEISIGSEGELELEFKGNPAI